MPRSRQSLPQLSVERELLAKGRLACGESVLEDFRIGITETKYRSGEEALAFTGEADGGSKQFHAFLHNARDRIAFTGLDAWGREVRCLVFIRLAEGSLAFGHVDTLEEAVVPFPGESIDRQWITVETSDTPVPQAEVLSPVRSYTGEIIAEDETRNEATCLRSRLGEWKLSRTYEWEDASIGPRKVSVRIPVPTVSMEVSEDERTGDIAGLLDRVEEELQPHLDVLSLLSRRIVQPLRMTVHTQGDGQFLDSTRVHRLAEPASPDEELVWPTKVTSEVLNTAVDRYVASAYREAIRTAIVYACAYWRKGFIETQVSNAFRAFEALTNGVSRVDGSLRTVDDDQFRVLRDHLKAAIKSASSEISLDRSTRASLYSKLPELKWSSLIPRACAQIQDLGVQWEDLFPEGSELLDELRGAYGRRSDLTHEGKLTDPRASIQDAARVVALTERGILRHLGVGDGVWGPWAFRHAQV